MAYPPPVPPATRTDATVMASNHPADHNLISEALTEILNHIAALEARVYPIGSIMMWGSTLPPGDHQFCDGHAVSRSEFPEVFSILGTTYGAGDGSTTFNLPSFAGRVPVGHYVGGAWANVLGGYFGDPDSQLAEHNHNMEDHLHGVSLLTDPNGDHWHQPASANLDPPAYFVASGPDAIGVGEDHPGQGVQGAAGIALGGAGYAIVGGTGNSGVHQHAVNGTTQGMTAGHLTGNAGQPGVSAIGTNENLQPSTTVNFVMRMH